MLRYRRYFNVSQVKTIERIIFFVFLFSIPFGTRTLIVYGANEYQSAFVYATDVALVALFLLWLFFEREKKYLPRTYFAPLSLLIMWFFLSSIFSPNIFLGLYRTLKLAEFLWLFYYIRWFKFPQSVLPAIVASAVFQSVIGIIQFTTQRSLGLWILGEERLSPVLAGVAKLDFFGQKIIRAYGTFPHPNVLAAFLLFTIFLCLTKKKRFVMVIPLLALGLLLTFSRVGIFLSIIVTIFLYFMGGEKKRLSVFALSLFVFGIILAPHFFTRLAISAQDQAVSLRVLYMQNALAAVKTHPFFGVGPGRFTSYQQAIIARQNFPQWANQPVHNIYLLLASEAGPPALIFVLWFLFTLFLRSDKIFIILCSSFLILALFDHFFFTYQQGLLLFWLTLGIASGKVEVHSKGSGKLS